MGKNKVLRIKKLTINIFAYSFLFFFLYSCADKKQKESKEKYNLIHSALNYSLDSIINKKLNGHFNLSDVFSYRLSDSILINACKKNNIRLDDTTLNYMILQNKLYKGKKIRNYLTKNYQKKIAKTFKTSGSDYIYFELGVPLFSIDKQYFILYTVQFYQENNEINWAQLFFLFYREKNSWELIRTFDAANS